MIGPFRLVLASGGWAIGVFRLPGLVFLWLARQDRARDRAFTAQGVEIAADILDKRVRADPPSWRSAYSEVSLRWTWDPPGEAPPVTRTGWFGIDPRLWLLFPGPQPGQTPAPLPVRILPDDPARIEPDIGHFAAKARDKLQTAAAFLGLSALISALFRHHGLR